MKDLTSDETVLKGFVWESEQPKSRFDLYPLDETKKLQAPKRNRTKVSRTPIFSIRLR